METPEPKNEKLIQLKPITNDMIDSDALAIINRLRQHHFRAYICGGGVRDLLLGLSPKDFDLATDAHPNRLRRLFGNSRIIGRRFQLVHIFFKNGKIIEVATFRRRNEFAEQQPQCGCYLASDNTFGTPREDARRRDFTINGLFYDTGLQEVIDYVGGLEDLKRGVISSIGDPFIRFTEDPVRIIRAVRFAAKLDMTIDDMALEAIQARKEQLRVCSVSRIAEELMRLIRQKSSLKTLKLLFELGLMDVMLPELAKCLRESKGELCEKLFWERFAILDECQKRYSVVTDAMFLAALYALYLENMSENGKGVSCKAPEAILEAVNETPVTAALPRAIKGRVMEIISAYRALSKNGGNFQKTVRRLKERRYFPEAYAFWFIEKAAREGESAAQIPQELISALDREFNRQPVAGARRAAGGQGQNGNGRRRRNPQRQQKRRETTGGR